MGVETAGEVVLAAGSWTPELARGVLFVPVEAGKGYHVELPAPPEPPAMPVISHEARIVLTPLPGRMRVAGTLDLTGLDMAVDPARVDALVRAAGRIMPALAGARVRGVWRGLRPCAPDGLPIVGRTERLDNLILATAHAMMGLTLAPLTGDVVADLVRGARSGGRHGAAAPGPVPRAASGDVVAQPGQQLALVAGRERARLHPVVGVLRDRHRVAGAGDRDDVHRLPVG